MAGPAKSNQEVFAPGIRPDFVGLIRFAHPTGQPAAVIALRYVSSLLIVPTLCVVTPLETLRVLLLAGRRDQLKRRN